MRNSYCSLIMRLVLPCMISYGSSAAEQTHRDADASPLDWFNTVYLQAGASTHWRESEDHKGTPRLIGIEAEKQARHSFGVSLFNNSFDQFCQYYYYGYKWQLPSISKSSHFKLTAGLIHGYKDKYEDKIPFNNNGWAPAIIPSIGWKHDRLGFDVFILGDTGLMFTLGYDIWQR